LTIASRHLTLPGVYQFAINLVTALQTGDSDPRRDSFMAEA